MSEDIGAAGAAHDAGVSVEAPVEVIVLPGPSEVEVARDTVARLRSKVTKQEAHLAQAQAALAEAEAALAALGG